MCGRGGNCEGDCEATAVHLHPCPVSGCVSLTDCTGVDCDDEKLCEAHANLVLCDWCREYVAVVDGSGNCSTCAAGLEADDWDAEDAACDDADAANKDEKES